MSDIGVTHKTTTRIEHRAECACGWRGPWTLSENNAHDWVASHLKHSPGCDVKPDEVHRG